MNSVYYSAWYWLGGKTLLAQAHLVLLPFALLHFTNTGFFKIK